MNFSRRQFLLGAAALAVAPMVPAAPKARIVFSEEVAAVWSRALQFSLEQHLPQVEMVAYRGVMLERGVHSFPLFGGGIITGEFEITDPKNSLLIQKDQEQPDNVPHAAQGAARVSRRRALQEALQNTYAPRHPV